MSKDNVKKLFGKIEKDSEMKKKYAGLMQAYRKESDKALSDKLVELGKTSGFVFSHDDLMAARAELMDKNNSGKELSDGDLTSVAGGGTRKGKAVVFSIMTAGIACAVQSAIQEQNSSGGCGKILSTTAAC